MMRVSPPELAREFPGPQQSMSMTRAPRRSRNNAVQPPKAPAPTTVTEGFLPDCAADFPFPLVCMLLSTGVPANAPHPPAVAHVLRNHLRETFSSVDTKGIKLSLGRAQGQAGCHLAALQAGQRTFS